MNDKSYIPKNTCDVAAIERLKQLPFEFVREDVPELLEWGQDAHWDVASGVYEYLAPYINEITSEILFVLNTNDGMWKYFLIYGLIGRSKIKLNSELIDILRRLAEQPSRIDAEDGVDEAARDILTNKSLCG